MSNIYAGNLWVKIISLFSSQKPVNAVPPPIQQPATSSPPQTQSPGNQSLQSSKSSGSTAMDLLGDLGGDPFSSPAQSGPPAGGMFWEFLEGERVVLVKSTAMDFLGDLGGNTFSSPAQSGPSSEGKYQVGEGR